jgi:hypothetical protein
MLIIKNGDEIPFGKVIRARKKSLVTIREPNGAEEKFKLAWGDLTAIRGQDIVIQSGEDEYPCKIDIFNKTYDSVGNGKYQKNEICKIIKIPEGVKVRLVTLEGEVDVSYPDYIAIGKNNEVYCNGQEWVNKNLKFVED